MWRTAVLLALCVAPPASALADDGIRSLHDLRERDWSVLRADILRTPRCGPKAVEAVRALITRLQSQRPSAGTVMIGPIDPPTANPTQDLLGGCLGQRVAGRK